MGFSQIITWETLRFFDSATLSGAHQQLGVPLAHPAYKIKMVNTSNVLVTVSIDGANDVDVAPANSFWLYDESQGSAPPQVQSLPAGTQIYIKGNAGVGLIYLVVQYIV